ncbi:MAG TPA: hypothetical protein VKT32_13770, partial [Chthonomonadaceae bacterium]|nr:hypothetical protein [Chthonomonadaceae bacterium]
VMAREAHLERLDASLRQGDVAEAYYAGDAEVLRGQMGMNAEEVAQIREGAEMLARWRAPGRCHSR